MPFPDSPRVLYGSNPLEQVICQVRFPDILKIDSETPAKFQERIRKEFPLFEEQVPGLDISGEVMRQLPADFLRLFPSAIPEKKSYNFSTMDKQWTIALTREFIALTATKYERWEDFKRHFESPFNALIEEYEPGPFVRVGLRYRNIINRGKLGLALTPWSELLAPHIVGILGVPFIKEQQIEGATQLFELKLTDGDGKVKVRHGLVHDTNNREVCYLIDSDFYAEGIKESEDVITRLDRFNSRAGRLFRWCITDVLHQAMEPKLL